MKKIAILIICLSIPYILFSSKGKYIITATSLNVRSEPHIKSSKITNIKQNTIINVIEWTTKYDTFEKKTATWVKIQLKDGKKGYVFSGFIEKVTQDQKKNIRNVRVFVKKIKSSPPTFQYKVINVNHKYKIFMMALGHSTNKDGMIFNCKQNIPNKILSPTNWKGKYTSHHEQATIGIGWDTRVQNAMKPGDSVDGFIIEMPEPKTNDYLRIKADMMNLSFEVLDIIGDRMFGFVEKISNYASSSN